MIGPREVSRRFRRQELHPLNRFHLQLRLGTKRFREGQLVHVLMEIQLLFRDEVF
jgi:hypothetical protein